MKKWRLWSQLRAPSLKRTGLSGPKKRGSSISSTKKSGGWAWYPSAPYCAGKFTCCLRLPTQYVERIAFFRELRFRMNSDETLARRTVLGAIGSVGALSVLVPSFAAAKTLPRFDWHKLALDVRGEMAWAWRNYVERAFGHDQIKPVSGT